MYKINNKYIKSIYKLAGEFYASCDDVNPRMGLMVRVYEDGKGSFFGRCSTEFKPPDGKEYVRITGSGSSVDDTLNNTIENIYVYLNEHYNLDEDLTEIDESEYRYLSIHDF